MLKEEEINVLLNDLLEIHGYDFTAYSPISLKRRINRLYELDKFSSFKEFRFKVRLDSSYLNRFIEEITVNVTDMFRDSLTFKDLKELVFPALAKLPLIRIWHAGCSTGEEVFSMAIFLHEFNLLHKSLIFATDINPGVLEKAKTGIVPTKNIKKYFDNYQLAGGINDFTSYYKQQKDGAKFNDVFLNRIIFSHHNLVSDDSFNTFHLIVCRNVLIYFDKQLQERIFTLFDSSLSKSAFIILGEKETLKFSSIQHQYKQVGKEKIWMKSV
jgi:chemotaxis protein methyltransferase CheR